MLTRARRMLRTGRAILSPDSGFTLIELFVVLIVIGILAAIAIPIYVNVQVSARDASVKSDLVQAKIFMVREYMATGSYPADYAELTAAGFAPQTSLPVDYEVSFDMSSSVGDAFCIRGTADTDSGARDFWISSVSGVVGPLATGDVSLRPEGC